MSSAHPLRARPTVATPAPTPEQEGAWVAGVARGDERAFQGLVQVYYPQLVAFAASFGWIREAAEDVVQDVLARLWMRRATWRPATSVRAYLLTAIRNEATNRLKRQGVEARYRTRAERDLTLDPDRNRTASAEARVTAADAVRQGLARLKEPRRLAVQLRYEWQLTYPEIAHVLGVDTKSAEGLVTRALQTLRRHLEGRV